MAADISKFITSFNKETARVANFEALISVPPEVPYSGGMQELRLRCEATELPGRTFATVDQKTYGPIEVFPVQNYFDKINLTFICSDDMRERNFFDRWMEYISNSTAQNKGVSFDFRYKDNYQTDIIIVQYNLTGSPSYSIKLDRAFPVAINGMPLSWDAQNTIQKVPVTFAYRYFTIL